MKKLIIAIAALSLMLMAVAPAVPQDAEKAADCSTYARNRSESETSAGGEALSQGVRKGIGGALFGALIDGGEGAKKGALIAGGLGAIGGGARASREREINYRYYYDECMRGRTR